MWKIWIRLIDEKCIDITQFLHNAYIQYYSFQNIKCTSAKDTSLKETIYRTVVELIAKRKEENKTKAITFFSSEP